MMMRRLPDIAFRECVNELRAACRLPIDDRALDELLEPLRANFDRILGGPEGPKRWADVGQRMRDNGRHLGALADFYGSPDGFVGPDALNKAFTAIKDACTVDVETAPVAFRFCTPPPPAQDSTHADEKVLVRAHDREPELV